MVYNKFITAIPGFSFEGILIFTGSFLPPSMYY